MLLLLATLLIASFQFVVSVDSNSCVIAGDSRRCPVDDSITYAGITNLLDASITCPNDYVNLFGFVKATQTDGLCTCDVDIYDAESGVSPPVQNRGQTPDGTGGGETVDCECYVCPDGSAQAAAFICESEIVGSCSSINCFGDCNEDPTASPTGIPTQDLPANNPTGTPTQADSAAQHFMFNPSMWLAGFAIAGVLR
jgi:hypothetical protein